MSNAEKYDPEMMKISQYLIEECKENKYKLAIFEFGKDDLVEKTTDLLIQYKRLEIVKNEEVVILPKSEARST